MQKKLRIFAIIIGVGFLIFLTMNLLLNKLLSEERLMAMLIDPAQKAIGREITLGSLDVSLLKGITITDINIKERKGKQDFVSIKTFRLSYQLLPLLRKHLVIKEILIDEPQIRIIKGSDNKFNFADIAQQHEEKPAELIPADDNNGLEQQLPLTMTFDQININKAILTLTDQTNVLPEIHSEADLTMSVALGKTLADTTYKGSLNLLTNGKYRNHKPVLQLTCEITEKLISYQGHLTVGFDKGTVNGWVANYLATPDIELNVDINSLDLDALASLEQLLNNNSEQRQKSSQPDRQQNPLPATKTAPIDLKLAAHGKVNIGQVSKDHIKVRDISLVYRLKDNIITLETIETLLFGGKIRGDISANIGQEQPAFQGEINCEKIKVAEIMVALDKPAESLSGKLASDLSFQGSGKEWSIIQKSLNGKGSFSLVDGGLQRTPITTALATLLGIQELNDLRFSDFSGDLTIANGKVALDANLQSQGISILAKGNVGLDGGLEMVLPLRLSAEYSKKSSVSRYLADDQGRATLQLSATGSIQKPKLTIASKEVQKQVGKVVTKSIMKELGKAIDKNRPANNSGSNNDPVKDVSGALLKKLFGN